MDSCSNADEMPGRHDRIMLLEAWKNVGISHHFESRNIPHDMQKHWSFCVSKTSCFSRNEIWMLKSNKSENGNYRLPPRTPASFAERPKFVSTNFSIDENIVLSNLVQSNPI
jgi:hypothetical protein